MKKIITCFVVFTLLTSLFAGLPIQPKAIAAALTDEYGFKETPLSLAPNAFTLPDKGYIENINIIEVDDSNNLYVIANETYVSASDIFHFTTDGNFQGRLITRDQLAAQLTGASWNTSVGAPTIEPVKMAFSKEGLNRYLYIVLKDENAGYPMIKLDLSTNTVVEDNLHVFTSRPTAMQKGKDGLIYISSFAWKHYSILDTAAAPLAVTIVNATLNDYISGIVSTEDNRYLVNGPSKAYICNELNLTNCTTLHTDYSYSNPSASENGKFSALGADTLFDNYLVLNENETIEIKNAFLLRSSFIEFTNNGDLIIGNQAGIKLYSYNDSERTYTFENILNSNRGEVYENEFIQMIVNPDNGHFFVVDLNTNHLDEFDEQGIYIRSKAFPNETGRVAYHDGYFFSLLSDGSPNMDIISADDFTLLKTVSFDPNDILWTPNGQFLALYSDKLEQYYWNAATKELVIEHTYPVGGYGLNMVGDGEQITFTEINSSNLYLLNPNTQQFVDTTHQLGYGTSIMDSSGLLIHHDWINLSIIKPNYGTVYQNRNNLYSMQWSYYSKDSYLVPKMGYDPASQKYKMIPVLVQMTTQDSNDEASFTTVPETLLYPAALVTGTTLDLGIDFPFNGTTLSEIQITDYHGDSKLFFTAHPETGIVVNDLPDAIYHAVIGSEIGKRMAVVQFSNVNQSWNKGTLQIIFFEETGEIVVQAETHQPTYAMSVYTYRNYGNEGYRGFPSGTAQSIHLLNDSFIAKYGRAYIPILLKTGNTLTAPVLNTPLDKELFDANQDEVILEWTNSNSSANYNKQYLLLSTDAGFLNYQQFDVTGQTSYNLNTSPLLPGNPYYWKVLAVNTITAEIAMSDSQQFAFKNWTIDLAISSTSFATAPVQVTLDTLNLNFIKKAGVAVSTSPHPTVEDEMLALTAPYQIVMNDTINGLQPDTIYYARAFATDGTETRYSQQVSFKTEKFKYSLQLENVNFSPTVTTAVYSATVPYEVSVTKATYDQTKGITSAELWVEDSSYGWETDIPLQVGLNKIASRFTDAVGTHDSTILVTREAARLATAATNVTASAGNGTATVRFDTPTDSGSYPIDKYVVTSHPGNIKAEGTTTEIVITGLTNGTSYRFSVQAVTAAGDGSESGLSNTVTPRDEQDVQIPPTTGNTGQSPAFDIWINGDGVKAANLNGESKIVSSREEKNIKLEISQKAWTELFVPQGFVQLEHQGIEYRFPVENIITDQMKQQLNISEGTTYSVVLHLQMDEQKSQVGSLPAGVVSNGKLIKLKLEIHAGEKSVEINRFNRFAQLRFPINSTDLTTAVRLDEKGISHIPTKFITKDGQTFAELSLISNGSFTMIQYSNSFNDIQGHWAEKQIQELANRRVVVGFVDGGFNPNQPITRAQLAALTARALGLGEVSYTNGFKDVSPEAWYANELEAAVTFDLLEGYDDSSFKGDSLVTREQAIVVLNRIAKLTGIRVKDDAVLSALASFDDANQISSWAQADVGAALSTGIIQGRSNGQIAPQEWMTRAELSAILYRWLLHTDRQS
ncbi:S-layer homology domain-containing protein [Paenibacillus sinopodophylli]|uniref:S-layer homology domain-containing protein n=1 Tax=Paenibacillus sinopodophylli TaxID=1837342 RepID=UPI00110CCFB7|nr:S-layer homology domain-containing protein [Paenibacillus sinopodophylli]